MLACKLTQCRWRRVEREPRARGQCSGDRRLQRGQRTGQDGTRQAAFHQLRVLSGHPKSRISMAVVEAVISLFF